MRSCNAVGRVRGGDTCGQAVGCRSALPEEESEGFTGASPELSDARAANVFDEVP